MAKIIAQDSRQESIFAVPYKQCYSYYQIFAKQKRHPLRVPFNFAFIPSVRTIPCNCKLAVGVVVEVALDKDNWCTFVAGAGCKVTERTDKVCELTWCCALAFHRAHQVLFLVCDVLCHSITQFFALHTCKLVVCQIFQFQLAWQTNQAVCEAR